nr:MAG: AraC family transcriptional regulator [Pseudomonadota bacterium]
MDALSDVLRAMRLTGGVYLHGEYRAPWCLSIHADPKSCVTWLGQTTHVIPYHYVLEGRVRVRLAGGEELELGPGETVMFPRNDPHLMGSQLDVPAVDAGEVVQMGDAGDWIRTSFHHAAEQIAAGHTGSEALMSKLSELLFIEAVQRYAEDPASERRGWLAAFADRHLARALALLHTRMAEPWTVEALGREVGLSRSALAARFVEVLGVPPMQYLANWRIHRAAHELASSGKPIPRIAEQVGYESEASFARAFRRHMGVPPATWRRQRLG